MQPREPLTDRLTESLERVRSATPAGAIHRLLMLLHTILIRLARTLANLSPAHPAPRPASQAANPQLTSAHKDFSALLRYPPILPRQPCHTESETPRPARDAAAPASQTARHPAAHTPRPFRENGTPADLPAMKASPARPTHRRRQLKIA